MEESAQEGLASTLSISDVPHVMLATLFRWPDLLDQIQNEKIPKHLKYPTEKIYRESLYLLRKIPGTPCSHAKLSQMVGMDGDSISDSWICCNPFHWSRVIPDPHPLAEDVKEGNIIVCNCIQFSF